MIAIKKNLIWKILLLVGIVPFAAPFVMSFTKSSSWSLFDWLILYSYVYWPTYVIGAAVIMLAAYKLVKNK